MSKVTGSATDSDKSYWHRFSEFYDRVLPIGDVKNILEFGIFQGDSIRWLRGVYPDARIFGFDILPTQGSWPRGDLITYLQGDQGDLSAMRALVASCNVVFDLVIEDGSHEPDHQRDAFLATLPHMASGSLFILEDAHTSFRQLRDSGVINGSAYTRSRRIREKILSPARRLRRRPTQVNLLSCLWAIEHARRLERSLSESEIDDLCREGFVTASHLIEMDESISDVEFFHRLSLPIRCHRCRDTKFDYASLTCACGMPLLNYDDSMSIAIHFR